MRCVSIPCVARTISEDVRYNWSRSKPNTVKLEKITEAKRLLSQLYADFNLQAPLPLSSFRMMPAYVAYVANIATVGMTELHRNIALK